MIAIIEDGYGKMRDILLLDNQLAKFVIEHEKDRLHVKQRTTIIVHKRSAMTIQHCINPPNFTKQALLFINGAQIIGIHQHSWTPQSPDNFGRSNGRTVAAMYTHSPTGGPRSGAHPEILTSNINGDHRSNRVSAVQSMFTAFTG